MKRLERIVLVQFYLFEAEEIDVRGNTAWLGPNGAGKTSTLDAVQIALLGAHQGYLKFNTQSTSTSTKRNFRSIRDYCLGTTRAQGAVAATKEGEESREEAEIEKRNAAAVLARDTADTYITLLFRDSSTGDPVTIGVSLQAQKDSPSHTVKGLYILPGVELGLNDHVETVKDETVPLRWKDFEHGVIAKATGAGRTPLITDKAETYIGELLHQLQPRGKGIDVREFLKAFKRSVMLRDIESVNDFVRDFVVEEHPIDKHKAISQIEHFRQLEQLVRQTQEQIKTLKGFTVRYEKVAADHREMATMDYLMAHYRHDELQTRQGDLEQGILSDTEEAQRAAAKAADLEQSVRDLRDAISQKRIELSTNPATREAADLNSAIEAAEKARGPHGIYLDRQRHNIASAFGYMNAIPGFIQTHPECEGMAVRLDESAKRPPDADKAKALLGQAVDLIERNRKWVDEALVQAGRAVEAADGELKSAEATLKAADKHGVDLGPNASMAIDILSKHGIQATPVCSLVRVKQIEWQPAVEAFLGRNRESLVISGGRERDAVRIMRSLPEGRRIYDVTIIQPEHLKQTSWSDPERVLVGSVIEGSNETAVAYVRMLLGKTRMVETEEELERYSRSLTVDGMLSANGGTRTIQVVRPEKFMIGVQISSSSMASIRRKLKDALQESKTAAVYRNAVAAAKLAVEKLGDDLVLRESIATACREVTRLNQAISDLEGQIASMPENGSIRFLTDAIEEDNKRLEAAEKTQREANDKAVACKTHAEAKQREFDALTPAIKSAREALDKAAGDQDFDQSIVERVINDHDSLADFTVQKRIEDCSQRRNTAASRMTRRLNELSPDFDRYLTSTSVSLEEERKDWRKAMAWVSAESVRLESTQLAQFEEEVAVAQAAAEKAFREDVAVRISERIQQTETNLKTLNKTLAACPTFSNGERYEFEARPAAAYKSLYEYITKASAGTDLFSGNSAASEELIKYLKQSADPEAPKSEKNPLDDYRLLFNFDLKITQNGVFTGRLSQRVGPGSNGEHRTPFYVIAGAALASAYRIRPGEENRGAALMLLDEAFHGMDSQNSLAAARFLKSLGLQLLIAAPDSELGKLMPVCDCIYELMRFGNDVFMEATYIKEAAHQLTISDMPAENPQLLLDKIAEIEASA